MSEFEMERSMMEATSMHRPDTAWKQVDAHGHVHQWWTNGAPATSYSPTQHYITPTLVWIQTGIEYFEDGMEIPIGDLHCVHCNEIIKPGYCADSCTRYVPGLTRFRVNGRSVSKEEYIRRWKEEHPDAHISD
jgi:hypothetical protein